MQIFNQRWFILRATSRLTSGNQPDELDEGRK
jgi:hypothetical protein